MNLPQSKLTKHQVIIREKTIGKEKLIVEIRHDDECGNGHNTFAITGDYWERPPYTDCNVSSCGQIIDEIKRFFPELIPYLKWHLCTTDGPLHYIANTLYHARDRDCWGLRKGEKRQIKNGTTGKPVWRLIALDENGQEIELHQLDKYKDSDEWPDCPYILSYVPWYRIGEGKEPDLEAARASAIWPEAELEDFTEEKLLARLPGLMAEFKAAVESLGLEY